MEKTTRNFEILHYSKLIDSDEIFVTIRFYLPLTQEFKTVTLSMSDVRSRCFSERIPVGFIMDDIPSKKYAEIIREQVFEMSKNCTNIKTLLPQGFHFVEDRYVYVIGDYIINEGNADVWPYNPNGFYDCDYSSILRKDAVQWVKLYLNQGPDKAVMLLGSLSSYLKPIVEYFNLPAKNINIFAVGKSGCGKTSFSKLLTEDFSVNLGTDTAALYGALQKFAADCPILIDDLNLSSSPREMDKKLQRLSELIQLTSGGGAMIVEGKEIEVSRLGLLITGEYLPESISTINRTVVVRCSDTFSAEALTELQSHKHMFSAFVILFLDWFLQREKKIRTLIAENLVKDTFEYKGRCGSQDHYTGYPRIMASHKLLKITSYLLLHFLCYVNGFKDDEELNRVSKILDKGITTAIEDTLDLVRTDSEESKILSVILKVIHTDPDHIMAKSYDKYRKSEKLLFRHKDDYYYFRGESLARYIESKCGESVTTKKLSSELLKANLLVPCGGEFSFKPPLEVFGKKKPKQRKRYYRLGIPALEDLLDRAYPSYFEKINSPLVLQRNDK